jgi:hypothetical protein
MTTQSIEERQATDAKARATAFDAWLQRSETKLMLSLIPPADNPDAFKTLLASCFEAGSSHGGGQIASTFIEAIFKGMDKKLDKGRGDF